MKLNLRNAAGLILAASIITPAFSQAPGADIYKQNCAVCHGEDGMSKTPVGQALKAASLTSPAVVHMSDADLLAVIKSGKNSMPSFSSKLTDDQIKTVIAYIRTLQK